MSRGPSESPPCKRMLLDTDLFEESAASTVITRSHEFWFEDGSMVLEAETTQFRVHKGILDINSNFFKDMFTLSQHAPDDEPSIEGCAVVRMQDTSEDWQNLLTFMYCPTKLPPLKARFPVSVAISVLRLSKKYQFDTICHTMYTWLAKRIPMDVRGPENLRKSWPLHTIFEIINIATELDITSVLPTAYYVCAVARSMNIDVIIDGMDYRDNDKTVGLSDHSQRSLLRGREKLKDLIQTHILFHIAEHGSVCPASKKCRIQQIKILNNAAAHMHELVESALDAIPIYLTETKSLLCYDCYAKASASHQAWRTKFWNALPSHFELPAWDAITDFKNY